MLLCRIDMMSPPQEGPTGAYIQALLVNTEDGSQSSYAGDIPHVPDMATMHAFLLLLFRTTYNSNHGANIQPEEVGILSQGPIV